MSYQIHNADCVTWMQTQPDHMIDMVLTSPPYDDIRSYSGHAWSFEHTAQELIRLLRPGGVIVWNVADATQHGSESGTSMRQALYFMDQGLRLHDTMIYAKRNPMPTNARTARYHQAWEYLFVFSKGAPATFNPIMVQARHAGGTARMRYRGQDGVTHYKSTPRNDQTKVRNIFEYTIGGGHTSKNPLVHGHPAVMHEQLALDMISTWSQPGDLILDPFAGAGTTLWACAELGRRSIGCETNPDYVALVHRRLA